MRNDYAQFIPLLKLIEKTVGRTFTVKEIFAKSIQSAELKQAVAGFNQRKLGRLLERLTKICPRDGTCFITAAGTEGGSRVWLVESLSDESLLQQFAQKVAKGFAEELVERGFELVSKPVVTPNHRH